jgi:hypothetical protein
MKEITFAFLLATFYSPTQAQQMVPVENGVIKGNFSLFFPDLQVTLQPQEMFNLTRLGMVENDQVLHKKDANQGILTKRRKDRDGSHYIVYKGDKLHYYEIQVTNLDDHKTYYGLILFFKTPRGRLSDAVSQAYLINFSDALFAGATEGNYSYSYEYSSRLATDLTWFLLVSDSPLPPIL